MDRIIMHDFRCFKEMDVRFKSGVNLLIGDNASGKTSVLKACKYVLSAFFSGFSDENTRWMSFEDEDFLEEVADGIVIPERPIVLEFSVDDIFHDIEFYTHNVHPMLYLKKIKKKRFRMLREGLDGYVRFGVEMQTHFFSSENKRQVVALPLFASFSTDDIHSKRLLNESKFKAYNQKNSFGYYECLEGNGFLRYWHKRMMVLSEAQRNMEELAIVRRAVSMTLGSEGCGIIRDVEIRPVQKKVYYVLCDGREVDAEILPDGYRRIVNIVVDLAFRCALLNRSLFGEQACLETRGTVIIDEIDMHLHPSLQAKILNSLHHGFPRLQFIVSSHAPMVMTGVENNDVNSVYRLKYEGGRYSIAEENTYGMDMSTLGNVVLNIVPRDKDVEKQLERLFSLIDAEQVQDAKALLSQMRERFGDNLPELAKAETMLNFIS